MKLYKPGEKPLTNGIYIETGPRGGVLDKPRKTTNGPGSEKLSPTSKKGNKWTKKYWYLFDLHSRKEILMAKTKTSIRGKQKKKIVVVKGYKKKDGTRVHEHRRSTVN